MRLALPVVIAAALVACGTVEDEPATDGPTVDASVIDGSPLEVDASGIDGTGCPGNTVDACGLECRVCPGGAERQVPTCDGNACGLACRDSAPTCSDGSCSRLLWTFEDASLGGVFGREPSGLQVAVRNFNGANAVGADVTLGEIALQVPVCASGVLDTRSRTLTFDVFLDNGTTSQGGYYVQAEIPNHQNGAYLRQVEVGSGAWTTYTAPMNLSQFAATTSFFSILIGTYGGAFTGTVWVDNIRIQ